MMKKTALTFFVLILSLSICKAQDAKPEDTEVWQPVPEKVTPGTGNQPPSDAIVLFDGSGFEQWESEKGGRAQWNIENEAMVVNAGTGNIQTKQKFTDFQLHIEWMIPTSIDGKGQARGNSGIFLQKRYEIQVLGSYNNKTYVNGMAASVYKESIPLVNATRPQGKWQMYDIIYKAPQFDEDGNVESKARVTVLLNGVLVQNNFEIQGLTLYVGKHYYEAHGAAPLMLQDHHNPVHYRNIWIRRL